MHTRRSTWRCWRRGPSGPRSGSWRTANGEAARAAPAAHGAGPRGLLRGRAGRLRAAAPAGGRGRRMPGDRPGADPQASGTASRPTVASTARRAAARGPAHGGASPDHRQVGARTRARGRRDSTARGFAPPPGEAAAAAGIAYDVRNWTLRHRRLLTRASNTPPRRPPSTTTSRASRAWRSGCARWSRNWPRAPPATTTARRWGCALLPRGRHGDGDDGAGRTRRRHALRQRPAVLPRADAERAQQRGAPAAGADHEDVNSHVRRILVESAWHYRHPPRVGAALRKRREGQPGWAVRAGRPGADPALSPPPALAAHGKPSVVANTAVAREAVGGAAGVSPHPREAEGRRPRCRRRPIIAARAETAVRRSGAGEDG